MISFDLGQGYTCEETDPRTIGELFRRLRRAMFDDVEILDVGALLSDEETSKLKILAENTRGHMILRLLIKYHGEIVGWSIGDQTAAEVYYMRNTALLHEHRGKGVYKRLLEHLLRFLADQGFQKIYSRHHPGNNGVIVPKLKAGFMITGMEVADDFGTLVVLTYYTNDARRRVLQGRTGELGYREV